MKRSSISKILALIFLVGCILSCNHNPKPPQLNLKNGQVCLNQNEGSQICLSPDDKHVLVLKKQQDQLQLSSLAVDSLYLTATSASGATWTTEAFGESMRRAGKLYPLAENIVGFDWKGNQLTFMDAAGAKVETFDMKNADGLIAINDFEQKRISLVGFGAAGCEVQDLKKKLNDRCSKDTCILAFTQNGEAESVVSNGGGLSIILIDPAISDPGLDDSRSITAVRINPNWIKFMKERWTAGPPKFEPVGLNYGFFNLEKDKAKVLLSEDSVPLKSEVFVGLAKAIFDDWRNDLPLALCKFDLDSIEIKNCGSMITIYDANTGARIAVLDDLICAVYIVKVGNRLEIYRKRDCIAKDPQEICRPITVP